MIGRDWLFLRYCLAHSPVPVIVVRPGRKLRKAAEKRRADPRRGKHFESMHPWFYWSGINSCWSSSEVHWALSMMVWTMGNDENIQAFEDLYNIILFFYLLGFLFTLHLRKILLSFFGFAYCLVFMDVIFAKSPLIRKNNFPVKIQILIKGVNATSTVHLSLIGLARTRIACSRMRCLKWADLWMPVWTLHIYGDESFLAQQNARVIWREEKDPVVFRGEG